MAERILVAGKNSFLARAFLKAMPPSRVRPVGHDELERPDLLDGVKAVINFARDPASSQDGYDPAAATDPDHCLARRIGERDIAYVMLSTRKVYRPANRPLTEGDPTLPFDAYGKSKLAGEQLLSGLLGDRLTILRLANIFGDERIEGRRTFFALSLNRLATAGQIRYDMSPFVVRDFLPADCLARILAQVVEAPPGGIINVGSGIALATGKLALWLMEGFEGGELSIIDHREKDPFVLAIDRLVALYGRPCTEADIKARCLELGRRLRRPGAA